MPCGLTTSTYYGSELCRELKSIEETAAAWKNALDEFTGGDAGEECILSWTFARQKQDLAESHISGFVKLLERLHDDGYVSDGAGACMPCGYI
jgi:hypothetical protein